MPVAPYLVSGTVKKGPRQGYAEVETTVDTSVGSSTVNVQIDSGASIAASQTVTILNVTKNQSGTAVTDSSGNYSFDIANLSTEYSNGDTIRVYADTISATRVLSSSDSTAQWLPGSHGRFTRVIAPGRLGKEYTENYPLPVNVQNLQINAENPSAVYTYSGGVIATETVTIKGRQYRKTYTSSGGQITDESAWVEL